MANTVLIRKVVDGPRHIIVHCYLASDGATGELTDQVVVDVSSLTPVPTLVTIEKIYGHISGFTATLEFDATTDVPFATMPNGEYFEADFQCFGGLKDNSGTGTTGDIVLTTSGFTVAADTGWFVIIARKN